MMLIFIYLPSPLISVDDGRQRKS